MFIREAYKGPPGSTTTYEVKYSKGRKPFPTLAAAKAFAAEQRVTLPSAGAVIPGWAEVNQIVSINVEARS